jgi:hypothetical protein
MTAKEIYIVTAFKFGDRSAHSYPVAWFKKKHAAIKCADKEKADRGGKYEVEVYEMAETVPHLKNVYTTASQPIYE